MKAGRRVSEIGVFISSISSPDFLFSLSWLRRENPFIQNVGKNTNEARVRAREIERGRNMGPGISKRIVMV